MGRRIFKGLRRCPEEGAPCHIRPDEAVDLNYGLPAEEAREAGEYSERYSVDVYDVIVLAQRMQY